LIRVLIARQAPDGSIQVLGHGAAPGKGSVMNGVVQDRVAARESLRRALRQAEREGRCRPSALFCGVNGRKVETFIREGNVEVENGEVEYDHLAEARDIASRDLLAPGKNITSSVTSQEWYVDGMRVSEPLGIKGQVLKGRIHFARIPSVVEDNMASCVDAQRRELEDVIFLPLAASLGCLTPEDMELGVAVLDLGRTTTGLAVYRNSQILDTRSFNWGAYHLTRDVAAGLHVSFDEADELVEEYGINPEMIALALDEEDGMPPPSSNGEGDRIQLRTAVPGAPDSVDRLVLDEIVFERAKELLVQVRQHLHARGLIQGLVRGVVLTGGASKLRNQVLLAEAVFDVPCRIGYPNSVEILPDGAKSPDYSGAVGIVRHAFDYRNAVRSGRVEANGAMVSLSRRIGRFLRRYFL
jgi:cell division protein FtsA